MSTDRSEYRDHIIEITLSAETGGRWQGDWAVFEKKPFLAVAAGVLATPRENAAAARAVAWRAATDWVDAYVSESEPCTPASTAATLGKRR